MMPPARRDLWDDAFGFLPHKVWVGERADKKGVLYLRWWVTERGNWKWRSLRCTARDERGRLLPHIQQMAREKAREQYELLTGVRAGTMIAASGPLTLGATWLLITDPKSGQYPHDSPHRREVGKALRDAVRILAPETPWAILDRTRYRILMRTRVDELRAKGRSAWRAAEITMARIHAVAAWLRDNEHIPATAAIPASKWRDELREYVEATHGGRMPAVKRPRHTLEEMRTLLGKSWDVDPRFGLLMAIGAELRLGQVVRAWRSDVNLEHNTLTVQGRGKKGGVTVLLTAGQRAAFDRALSGYLAKMERELPDYPLFPQGQLTGGRSGHPVADPERHGTAPAVGRRTLLSWFRETEEKAEIPHVKGRAAYGIRRVAVDGVKELRISREGLQQHGGWADSQIPDRIYADQQNEAARREAMEKRALIRGEIIPVAYPDENAQGTADEANDDTTRA